MSAFEPVHLPLSYKQEFCEQLLAEFGAGRISHNPRTHELTVCCVLPDHDEGRPSASLNYDKLVYACLSCNESGGILWLISACNGYRPVQARDWLMGKTGLGGDDFDLGMALKLIAAYVAPATPPPPIPRMSPRVLGPWRTTHPYLTDPVSRGGRGIPLANAVALDLGYAERYPLGEGKDGQERVSRRIIVPLYWRGSLVGWQSRQLDEDGTPKYLSTQDLPRDRVIYNYQLDAPWSEWVESPLSVARHYHHLPIEATLGAMVTREQVRLLAHREMIVLWPDPGAAGVRSMWGIDKPVEGSRRTEHKPGLIELLAPYAEVRVVDSPWDADAGDVDDDEVARELVEHAVPGSTWEPRERLLCWHCDTYHGGECSWRAAA